jgi:hypothetical protein
MAGGKETPRQKMIGMMYLVLTALLALNVSKSILDAFVAIEENTQKSAIVQLERGDQAKKDFNTLIGEAQKMNNFAKVAKCKYYLGVIEKIDAKTADMIETIDKIKLQILKDCGEKVDVVKDGDKEAIVWKRYDKAKAPCRPTRLNLMAVQSKDEYDKPMFYMFGGDIKNPDQTKEGMKLWKKYNDYRASIVEIVGSLHSKIDSVSGKGIGNPKFTVKTSPINKFESFPDLDKQVTQMLSKTAGDNKSNEDFGVLKQLYMELTKQEIFKEVNEVTNVHWIGKTFDHSPLVAAMASLTAMQLEILNARATASGYLLGKVGGAQYSFNRLVALADGPGTVSDGEQFEIRVVVGAYDTDNVPEATGGSFTYQDGMAIMKATGSGTDMTYSGTISIKDRSGAKKELPWEKKIAVVKGSKEATITCEDLKVVYVGIPMTFKASASGMYNNVSASPSQVIAKATDKTVTVYAKGTDTKGNSVSLGSITYTVKPAPKPELLWNGTGDGGRGNKNGGNLSCVYGANVPFSPDKGKFTIISYTISISGIKGSLDGNGSSISPAHLNVLKAAPPGKCSISVKYSGTSQGRVTSMYDI